MQRSRSCRPGEKPEPWGIPEPEGPGPAKRQRLSDAAYAEPWWGPQPEGTGPALSQPAEERRDPEPWWGPQPAGPGPALRQHMEEPGDPEPWWGPQPEGTGPALRQLMEEPRDPEPWWGPQREGTGPAPRQNMEKPDDPEPWWGPRPAGPGSALRQHLEEPGDPEPWWGPQPECCCPATHQHLQVPDDPEPCWGPQPEGPGPSPALCQSLEEPDDPEPWQGPLPEDPGPTMSCHFREPINPEPPSMPHEVGPAASSASVIILPAGCLVKVTMNGVDQLLQPPPTTALQVLLPDHDLFVIPEGILHTISIRPQEPGRFPGDPRILRMDAAASWGGSPIPGPCPPAARPSPERQADGPMDDMVHLLRPFPGSSLKPLPPSPPPSPQRSPQKTLKFYGPARKACRRLF